MRSKEMKLTFVDARGPAERLRYILHYADVPFEDVRLPLQKFPAWKNEQFMSLTPVFEKDGKQLYAGNTIGRYLARKYDLIGETVWEEAQCDMLVDGADELWLDLRPINFAASITKDFDKAKEQFAKFKKEKFIPFMDTYEKILEKHEKKGIPWLVGKKVTWADFVVAEWLDRIEMGFEAKIMKYHPKLKQLVEKVHNLPNLRKYIEERPVNLV